MSEQPSSGPPPERRRSLTEAQIGRRMDVHPVPAPHVDVPVFGVHTRKDLIQPHPEKPRYITIGRGTWLLDSPRWDPTRVTLGRADKPTSGEVLQELEDPRDAKKEKGKRRVALELGRGPKDSRGRYVRRFWVSPDRNGFWGMPKRTKIEPAATLGLDDL